jgi:putative nucleotidyltransferase with HDIG domain
MSLIKPIGAYVVAVFGLGLLGFYWVDWTAMAYLGLPEWTGLAALIILGLLSEASALSLRLGDTTGNSSITFLPLVACAIVFGPAAACLFIGVTGVVVELLIRRKTKLKAIFNVGQYLLAAAAAGIVFGLLGGTAQVLLDPGSDFSLQILPFAAFGIVFLLSNQLLVAGAVALHQGVPIRTVVIRMIGTSSGTAIMYDIAVTPLAVAVAFLYMELGIPGLLVLVLPLLFIRHSYLINYRLLTANRNLLRALVKAIETRDPYTSGHSLRVAELARDIGKAMGLPKQRIEEVGTAALLHDIGKIDQPFTSILSKSGTLSAAERDVIENHVTRGVEILASVSSFSPAVLDSVLHHHERVDGTGYPDGLMGGAIPLGARIIGVCDAVDAMLSTRAYRPALSLPQVIGQLRQGEGTQFDSEVVSAVLDSGLLHSHRRRIRNGRLDSQREVFEVVMPPEAPRRSGQHTRVSIS